MSSPRLPLELTDEVIAYVCPDTRTLFNCLLVCSSWVPAAQLHLFHHVRLDAPYKYNALVSRVLRSDTLKSYLLSVHSVELAEHPLAEAQTSCQGSSSIYRSFVHQFAGRLPNLTQLALVSIGGWNGCPLHPSMFMALATFPSISELELRHCSFPSFAHLRRLLTSLPALTKLTLVSLRWPESTGLLHLTHGAHRTMRPSLSSLSILRSVFNEAPYSRAQQLLTWIAATPTPSSLRTLELEITDRSHTLGDYLKLFRPSSLASLLPSISKLHVTLMNYQLYGASAEVSPLLQLSHFPNLKSIDLTLRNWPASSWKVVPHLKALRASCLARLHVLTIMTAWEASNGGADALADNSILDGELEHFTELQAVIVVIVARSEKECLEHCRMSNGQFYEALRDRLPKLMARGIVRIRGFGRRFGRH